MKSYPETNTLFILPPSVAALEQRLKARGTETEETLNTRIGNAKSEIEAGTMMDDPECLIGYRLINSDLQRAKAGFLRIFENLYANELGKRLALSEKRKNVIDTIFQRLDTSGMG